MQIKMENHLSSYLTNRQKDLIISPIERGKTKASVSQNYEDIRDKCLKSFNCLWEVAELLPNIEKNSKMQTARDLLAVFELEKLQLLIDRILAVEKEKGASISEKKTFDPNLIDSSRLKIASYLIQISSDYIMQAFPKHEASLVHSKIFELQQILKGFIDDIEERQRMKAEIDGLRQHVLTYKPRAVFPHEYMFTAECTSCKDTALGNDEDKARNSVKHLPKCKFHKVENKDAKEVKMAWFRILTPTNFLLTKEEWDLLNEKKFFEEIRNSKKP